MDIGTVLGWITDSCLASLDWIASIFEAIPGSLSFYLTMVTMFISTGLLLIPLRGGRVGSSDSVKKNKNTSSKGDDA